MLALGLYAQSAHQNLTDAELAKRDSAWFARYPDMLPIWETLYERQNRIPAAAQNSLAGFNRLQPPAPVRNIAEYEPMEGVLIAYPGKFGIPNALIKEMAEDVIVYCVATDTQSVKSQLQNAGVNMNNVVLINAKLNSIYTRDFGPWWIVNGNSEICITDFKYNRNRPDDDVVPGAIGLKLGVPVYYMDLTTCGGNYMTDGFNVSASSDLVWRENTGYTHQKIDSLMHLYLGITQYHVLPDPNQTTTIDHIDCWGKFLSPDKVLIRSVPSSNTDYNALEAVVDYFTKSVSSYGTPYKIYRVNSVAQNEAYTNSLILNNKVLVPISGTANDNPALAVYKAAMPGYEVLGFTNTVQSWMNLDALHCRANGIADRGMLYIRHIPLHDTVASADGAGYAVEATIIPYSKKALIKDSLLVFYRPKDAVSFSTVAMSLVAGNNYKAVIPQPAKSTGIAYYIHAADESKRSQNHPFIGGADPHVFYAKSLWTFAELPDHQFNNVSFTAFPTPFVSRVTIRYTNNTTAKENGGIFLYNHNGCLIRTWTLNNPASCVTWDGTDADNKKVSSGVYFCSLKIGGKNKTVKIQFVK